MSSTTSALTAAAHDPLAAFPTLFISGLPPSISELDIVTVLDNNRIEAKVVIDRDPVTLAPRVKIIFRYVPDAERFFATVNGSTFLGSKDPNMNFSNTSGSKTIVVKRIPLSVTSLELYDAVLLVPKFVAHYSSKGKVMMDRGGFESYALLQFEEQAVAERCISEMNGFPLRGSPITLSWQFPKNSTHIYPSMRSNNIAAAYGQLPTPKLQMPGLEGGINLAVSAGWAEQPMSALDESYSAANTSYDTSAITGSSIHLRPHTLNVLPTTGWHARASVNQTLIVSDDQRAQDVQSSRRHTWDEAVTITLEDLKSISPAHAALSSRFELDPSSLASPAPPSAHLDSRNLYVKNLPIDPIFDTDDLYSLFSAYGQIISARVMKDEATCTSKGFGFVSFSNEAEAMSAIAQLNGFVLDPALPKGLVVCVAEPRGFRERKLMVLHGNIR
ncbi:Polyadenylate-binding protein 4 [Entophlyctis luteolus]|nr:Polyadenylate-binding protein 4 [Entophlyctis luteolus]